MAEEQLERSVLDGKDREQLHAIAGAMGVRAATRMKKADLIEAILDAANGNGGDAAASDGKDDFRLVRCDRQRQPFAQAVEHLPGYGLDTSAVFVGVRFRL